ncbi:MAG: PocR ligand-binding domain-containing protein [Clostridia bacterium]|nr:PocR ligand-binding domain-containing protein [Clostridia bacterium]
MPYATIEEVLKDFHRISGFHVSVCDTELREIVSYPPDILPFCKRIQQNPQYRAGCIRCDKSAFEIAKRTGKPYAYQCYCGLYETIVPLYRDGVLVGIVTMGQVRDETAENSRQIAGETLAAFSSPEEQAAYLSTIRRVPLDMIPSYVNIISIVADHFARNDRLKPSHEDMADLIKKYINRHYNERITLDTLAEKFDCCKATVMNSFKKKFDTTVIAYLNRVRLDRAEQLVRSTDMSFKEISYVCGFYDQNYFSKLFNERFGCSPTAFRAIQKL